MKLVRHCGVLAAIFTAWLALPLFGDEPITNPVSPIVSYQFPEDFSSAVLTNGGIMSAIVSYQYQEWPGDDVLGLVSSLPVSYFWQYGSSNAGVVVVYGKVTNSNGVGIAGAAIEAAVSLSLAAQATTDGGGNYTLPALGAGVYVLNVTAAGYAGAARALTLSGSASEQDFQLTGLPAAPTTQQTTRQPPTAFTQPQGGPMNSTLKVFDETQSQFVAITSSNRPSAEVMTIVLTHGWQSNPMNCEIFDGVNGWPRTMAVAMRANGITTNVANIVAWDWLEAARFNGFLSCHTPPEERTPSQGVALGQNLQTVLGSNYTNEVHFLGHSLGTMVNAAAANYVHGDRTAQQTNSPTPWSPSRTHMTLFEHAEVSGVTDARAMFDGLTVGLVNPVAGQIVYGAEVLQHWKPSMPVRSVWADNYISYVGFYLPNTFNIALQKAAGVLGLNPVQAHGYPFEWYSDSIARPTVTPLGHQQSYEYGQKVGLPPSAFPSGLFQLGVAYHQNPSASDSLVLEPLPPQNYFQLIVPLFGNKADAVLQRTVGTVQVVGNVVAEVWDTAQAAGSMVVQGFEYAGNVAAQAGQTLVNLFDSPVLRLNLRTGPGFLIPQGQGNLLRSLNVNSLSSSSESNTQAMAWLPVQIPTNATAMAFDFIVAGDPVDDVMVCGIETNNLFSLETKYIPTNTVSASRLIDVSAWAGTTNELFFGLMGGTSTNATLQIDNIRFYSLSSVSSNFVDSVGDGIPDSWRAQYFPDVDPTGATTNNLSCAACDADGTGQNNLFKYLAGLNPTNPASIFRILSVDQQGDDLNVTWQTAGGRTNVLQSAPVLAGSYSNVSPNIVLPGSGDTFTNYLDTGGATNGISRFYGVRLVP